MSKRPSPSRNVYIRSLGNCNQSKFECFVKLKEANFGTGLSVFFRTRFYDQKLGWLDRRQPEMSSPDSVFADPPASVGKGPPLLTSRRSSGDGPVVGFGRQVASRSTSVGDGAGKSKFEAVEGNLLLEDVL